MQGLGGTIRALFVPRSQIWAESGQDVQTGESYIEVYYCTFMYVYMTIQLMLPSKAGPLMVGDELKRSERSKLELSSRISLVRRSPKCSRAPRTRVRPGQPGRLPAPRVGRRHREMPRGFNGGPKEEWER